MQDPENHLHVEIPRWFAVNTNYKREKLVRDQLEKKGITVYLPIMKVTRHYVRKKKEVELPLINCYLFVQITKQQYVSVLQTADVLQFVRFGRNLISIPEEEIQLLKRIIGEVPLVELESSTYRKGDQVEIIVGQLTGIKGKLVAVKGKKVVVVSLNTLQYDLLMEIEASHLRKITSK